MSGAVTRTGRVLRCVVSDAAQHGSLDFAAVCEVTAALRALEPDIGAVLLAGEGPHFCTGADVGALAAPGAGGADPRAAVRELAGELHDLVRALVEVPVPVVAAVRGWAAGAGMSLVLAADIAVAGASMGLVATVVPDDQVDAEALGLAQRLADGPTRALSRTKWLVRTDGDLDTHLDAEADAIAESVADAEGREGVAAFRERRAPRFVE